MLGDNPEKSKNPLKKAMRRRNAKTVTFASPTYFEASDIDYSTEEEPGEGDYPEDEEEESARAEIQNREEAEVVVVEPLRPRSHREKKLGESETLWEKQESDRASPDKHRTSEEFVDRHGTLNESLVLDASTYFFPGENAASRSRNGILRNTDSFFKDDTVETKKISLTPNLLRDDSGVNGFSSETKEVTCSYPIYAILNRANSPSCKEPWQFRVD
jgi:hypothetical protein